MPASPNPDSATPSAQITVGDLTEIPDLRLSVVAGEAGLKNPLAWASVGDDPRPWEAIDPGHLLLTSGWIIPAGPAEQASFVESLATAGISGLVVRDHRNAPALTDAMLAAADTHELPVMRVAPETSWTTLVLYVARASEGRETAVLNAITNVQNEVRIGLVSNRSSRELLEALTRIVRCPLYLVDHTTWEPLLPGTPAPPSEWGAALSAALAERGNVAPISIRLETGGRTLLALALPTEHEGFLFVDITDTSPPRLSLLQHVSAACALEIGRVDAIFDREWRSGSSLLSEALAGRLAVTTFGAGLEELGLAPPFVCFAIDASASALDRLDRYWAVRRIPHLMTPVATAHLILVADAPERRGELDELAGREQFRAGVSESFTNLAAVGDAGRQARWALETLPPGSAGTALYGDADDGFLPRTLLDAQRVVERILGPVLEYDEQHDGDLVTTLQVYLDCDRSPKRAAAKLFVHNQTVNYRLQRVQELTGRSLRSTADISELWLALRALAMFRTAPDEQP